MLVGIRSWCDVEVAKRVRGFGEACSIYRGPRKGGVDGSRRSGVGVGSR